MSRPVHQKEFDMALRGAQQTVMVIGDRPCGKRAGAPGTRVAIALLAAASASAWAYQDEGTVRNSFSDVDIVYGVAERIQKQTGAKTARFFIQQDNVYGFEDEEEAIRIANDTIYGLAAGVWTKDIGRAIRMSKALKAGTVWVNTYRAISYLMPFGGMKHSGLGRENGIEAIKEFLETKAIWISAATSTPPNPYIMRLT